MASNVIEYKLCDNNFDFENCLFDKAIRNLINIEPEEHTSKNIVSTISQKLNNLKYNDKTIYLKNSLIAKELCRDTFYLGINPILECFLDYEYSVQLNESRKGIHPGEKLIIISGDWGDITVSSPIDLVVYDKIGNTTSNSFNSQWFAIIGDSKQSIPNSKLSKIEWEKSLDKAINSIEEIKTNIPAVGDTMMDGGTMIKFLYQLVGSKKYVELLNSLFS
jgi:hypothetical protein